jgi:hypothetical protein
MAAADRCQSAQSGAIFNCLSGPKAANLTADMNPDDKTTTADVDILALLPGAHIGRYEVIRILGQGGFGITYHARDMQLGRDVAIKEYLPTSLAYRDAGATVLPRSTQLGGDFSWGRERFVAEGRTLATLQEAPGIVNVFDFIETNGTAYIVMEMVRGETIEAQVRSHGPMGPTAIDAMLWPLLAGLEQVHNAGFLHRDIKPANILLGVNSRPTLIDFGASRVAMAGRTTAMTAIFTPGYAAAEQFTSAKQGPWTDIYGLAATLHYAITGAAPPSAFDRMMDDQYMPLVQRAPAGFSPGLLAGIDVALSVRASDRPQSIAGWRTLLTPGALSADGDKTAVVRHVQAVPASAPAPIEPPAAASASEAPAPATKSGNRVFLYAGAAAAIAAVAAGGYLFLEPNKPVVGNTTANAPTPTHKAATVAPAPMPKPAALSGIYDGTWSVVEDCAAVGTENAYTHPMHMTVKDGAVHAVWGTEGKAGSQVLTGQIASDGSATLTGQVVTPRMMTLTYTVSAHFDANSGNGTRTAGRSCTFTFARKQ